MAGAGADGAVSGLKNMWTINFRDGNTVMTFKNAFRDMYGKNSKDTQVAYRVGKASR